MPIAISSPSIIRGGALALALIAGSAQRSDAAITVFTDFGAWSAAVGSFATETFAGNALNVPGLSFASTVGSIGTERFNDSVTPGGNLTIWSLGGSFTAFGGNWDLSPAGPGTGIALTLINAANVSTPVGTEIANTLTGGFFGIVSTDAFNRVLVTAGTQSGVAETYNVDNLNFGPTVPEPSTWAMMLIGFLGLGFLAHRRTSRSI